MPTYAHDADCNTIHDGPGECPPPREAEGRVYLLDSADAVLIRPGDTLIVRVAPTHQQALEEHRRRIREQLPGVWVVVIGADQLLVYRSNPDIAGLQSALDPLAGTAGC